jgi:hypothetical protein
MRSMAVFMSMPPSLRFGRRAGIHGPLKYTETLSAFMPYRRACGDTTIGTTANCCGRPYQLAGLRTLVIGLGRRLFIRAHAT